MAIQVQHSPEKHLFVTNIEGNEAFLEYRKLSDETWEYSHTYVPKALRGQGIANEIIKYALDFALTNHIKVKPSCPSVQHYLESHREYVGILV
jgi:predicted GNAT family acetyltransferase